MKNGNLKDFLLKKVINCLRISEKMITFANDKYITYKNRKYESISVEYYKHYYYSTSTAACRRK